MSAPDSNSPPSGDYSWVIILALVAFGAIWLLTRNEEGPLNSSAVGYDGLVSWALADQIDIRGRVAREMHTEDIGLRILPLFDTDLSKDFERPDEQAAYLKTGDEYDIEAWVVNEKTYLVRTLVIAPKWTRAMRHSGYAHSSLLLEKQDVERPLGQVENLPGRINRPELKTLSIQIDSGLFAGQTVTLYAPQLFANDLPSNCSSLIGSRAGHLLVDCGNKKSSVLALSDPDLLNNHGLTLGDNAALSRLLLRELSGNTTVVVDMSQRVLLSPTPPVLYKREWSDLLRFFAYPFSLIWLGVAVLSALAIWRSSVRFGPPRKMFSDGIGASKAISIAAKGRLLRLSGNDRELMEAQAENMLQDLAADILGPHRRADTMRQIVTLVARRNSELAAELSAANARVMTVRHDASLQHMLDLLTDFDAKLEKVRNEFGRTSVSG